MRQIPPVLEEVADRSLAPGERQVDDQGHHGFVVRTYRIFRAEGEERRELISHDIYPAKKGRVRVGPDH